MVNKLLNYLLVFDHISSSITSEAAAADETVVRPNKTFIELKTKCQFIRFNYIFFFNIYNQVVVLVLHQSLFVSISVV